MTHLVQADIMRACWLGTIDNCQQHLGGLAYGSVSHSEMVEIMPDNDKKSFAIVALHRDCVESGKFNISEVPAYLTQIDLYCSNPNLAEKTTISNDKLTLLLKDTYRAINTQMLPKSRLMVMMWEAAAQAPEVDKKILREFFIRLSNKGYALTLYVQDKTEFMRAFRTLTGVIDPDIIDKQDAVIPNSPEFVEYMQRIRIKAHQIYAGAQLAAEKPSFSPPSLSFSEPRKFPTHNQGVNAFMDFIMTMLFVYMAWKLLFKGNNPRPVAGNVPRHKA